jgi:hypothetical protein
MNDSRIWTSLSVATAAVFCLGACQPKSNDTPPSTSSTSTPMAPAPEASASASDTLPAAGKAGPSDGSTSIGGVASDKHSSGGQSGGTPAPTGGDGAASGGSK